jgi:CheY-like chemotaxis protein
MAIHMKMKILAIDDSKAIRFLLQTVLGGEYHVTTVPDGCSAMHILAKKGVPDLIIADPQLPDMGDWELIEHLSSSGIYGSIPIVVLSAMDKRETEAKCLQYGIRKYFLKPFNPIDLSESIKDLLEISVAETMSR